MINLFISLYAEKNPQRVAELIHCLKQNASNKLIGNIFVLNEGIILNGFAVHQKRVKRRPTYNDLFTFVNENTTSKDINIIANSDIYFDDTLYHLNPIQKKECYSLTRWNVFDKRIEFENTIGSQDCWIFRGKIKSIQGDFKIGIPGCDNRINHEIQRVGYKLYNPSQSIFAYHYHTTQKSYNDNTKRIPPPYKLIPSIKLPKRILHVSLGDHQRAQIDALNMIGDYRFYDWTKDEGKQLVEINNNFAPEVNFFQIQKEGILTSEVVDKLKGKIINWTGDVRAPLPKWYVDVGKKIHMTLFTNMNDVATMKREGCKADYLQIGYDQKVYYPLGTKLKECPEIVFMGNNYSHFPLSNDRRRMVKLLKEKYGNNFGLYGTGWGSLADGDFNKDEIMEAKILRSCKIAINLSHFNYGRYTSDRLFRIMGCNTFCISHWYKDMELDYKNSIHLKAFHEINRLPEMINYYLKEDKEREQIAKNGYFLVKNNHTWSHRIKELEQWI